jgi:hypothetical protein
VAWSRVYRIYYDKSRRLSLSSSGRKARYLSYIQNSYAFVHSFGTPLITPYLAIPPSCPVLSTAPVVVAIGPVSSVPIGRGDPRGTVRSAVRSGPSEVRSELWSDSGFELWGRTLGSDFGRVTHKLTTKPGLTPQISKLDTNGLWTIKIGLWKTGRM